MSEAKAASEHDDLILMDAVQPHQWELSREFDKYIREAAEGMLRKWGVSEEHAHFVVDGPVKISSGAMFYPTRNEPTALELAAWLKDVLPERLAHGLAGFAGAYRLRPGDLTLLCLRERYPGKLAFVVVSRAERRTELPGRAD